jgi:hypothetical protein
LKTSVYNPTGNSISERLNSHTTTTLKFYKNWKLDLIKEIIENRINNIYHTSVNELPKTIVDEYLKEPKNYKIQPDLNHLKTT